MSLRLARYPMYKDSGVPWMGGMPEHWDVRRLRQLCSIKTGGRDTVDRKDGGQYPFYVRSQKVERIDTYSYDGEAVLTAGDGAGVAKVFHYAEGKFDYHQRVYRFSAFQGLHGKFFYYYLMSSLRFEASRETAKSTVDSLRLPMLQNLPIALPSAAEQVTIAHCLDHANRRINRLIRAKRRLIELLNEQKQAIIHRAVTRGLDPDVRLRPSGIDWLGDVPEHWESIRLKYLFREVDDRSRDGVETLLSMRMYQGLVPHSQVSTKQIPNNSLIGFKRTEPSDIVMNRMRAAIGMFAVTTTPGIVSPDYAVLRSVGDSVPEYFLELFKTLGMRSVFRIESRGLGTGSSGFLRLYMDRFGVIHVPCPSASEQTQIVAHISGATKDLFAAQERIIREISLVTEYRTRLIADVVTGKLDVRGVELPPLDDDDALDEIDASEEGDADADALDEEPNERDA